MKKILIIFTALLTYTFAMAQSEYEALKFSSTDINGTARYMGMAGAFGALGGDASAIKDNPAGLGIYRKSEILGTLSVLTQDNSSKWNGINTSSSAPYKTRFDNFSLVISTPLSLDVNSSGLLYSNWSFSFNRLKNYNRSFNIKSGATNSSMTDYFAYFTNKIQHEDLTETTNYEPFDNINVPWMSVMAFDAGLMSEIVDSNTNETKYWNSLLGANETVVPTFRINERGYADEYSLGWSGNWGNQFYLGANLNFRTLDYSSSTMYSEEFSGDGGFDLTDSIYTTGKGVNLTLGVIYRPDDNLRFGLSIHTPTLYSIDENYSSRIDYDTQERGYVGTPQASKSYNIQTPMQINASIAYVYGKKALFSAEYVYANYKSIKLIREDDAQAYSVENAGMKEVAKNAGTIKLGAEYKLTDNFSVRGGFARAFAINNIDAGKYLPENTDRSDPQYFLHKSTDYFTSGFGYRESSWFVDFAYVHKRLNEDFRPYRSSELDIKGNAASVLTVNNNLLFTLGFKF